MCNFLTENYRNFLFANNIFLNIHPDTVLYCLLFFYFFFHLSFKIFFPIKLICQLILSHTILWIFVKFNNKYFKNNNPIITFKNLRIDFSSFLNFLNQKVFLTELYFVIMIKYFKFTIKRIVILLILRVLYLRLRGLYL